MRPEFLNDDTSRFAFGGSRFLGYMPKSKRFWRCKFLHERARFCLFWGIKSGDANFLNHVLVNVVDSAPKFLKHAIDDDT